MNRDLKHSGVLGMKWGVRRKRVSSQEHIESRTIKKKKIHEMTNAELKKVTERIRLETEYKKLNPSVITRGARVVSSIVKGFGGLTKTAAALAPAIKIGKQIMDEVKKGQPPGGIPAPDVFYKPKKG